MEGTSKRKGTLLSFFHPVPKKQNTSEPDKREIGEYSVSTPVSVTDTSEQTSKVKDKCEISVIHSCVPGTSTSTTVNPDDDIGTEIDKNTLENGEVHFTDTAKYKILKNPWIPALGCSFPATGKRRLKFQLSWLARWKWLAYSQSKNGAYCRYCVLFSSSGAGRGHQMLGALVRKPFNKWKDAVEQFSYHENSEYHKTCVLKATNFINVEEGKQKSVHRLQDSALNEQIENNRKTILPIIETIIFCGRQGIPVRGHRDCGPIKNFEDTLENDGNFRALLRFRVQSGDVGLKHHLQNSPKNAMYISPTTQNEIISSCNNLMLTKIIKMINSAECFSVLADETADISNTEQFSICARYLYEGKIREDFLQFVPVSDVSGKSLAATLLNALKTFGVKTEYLRGQGYDGAASMSGKFSGVQALVREEQPLALYVHCAAHSLNLIISKTCLITDVRNFIGAASKLCSFFNTPKRGAVLEAVISEKLPETRCKKLKGMCPTRWIERHDAILVLKEILIPVHESLQQISGWQDSDSSSAAVQLTLAIEQPSFLISLHILAKIFSLSLPLCRFLQLESTDLAAAINMVRALRTELQSMRENAEKEFKIIFLSASETAELLGCKISKPRTALRQTKRCNIDTNSPEEYFRLSIFLPFLDNFLSELKDRFLNHENILESFMCVIPDKHPQAINICSQEKKIINLVEFYENDLSCTTTDAVGELRMWYRHIAQLSEYPNPKTAMSFFLVCNKEVFPIIHRLLKILITLPISTSTSERSFSTLRRLKTYLRSTIGEHRLNGLALMNIHREIQLSPTEVLNNLAEFPRRLEFRLK